jgi:outer membrane protein OmpA-like peptidoglycan-associated protein
MRHASYRGLLPTLATGIVFFSASLSYGQHSPYDPYGADPYSSRRTQPPYSYDRSAPYGQPPYARSAPQPQAAQTGSSAPFGLSKSAAGAIAGAALGAGSGAIIGSTRGDAGPGAAIGAGIGAVGGYMIGRQIEGGDQSLNAQQQVIEQQRQEIARNRALLEELKRRSLDARETSRGVVVNLPNVLFAFNSARLLPTSHAKVADIAAIVKQQAGNRRVSVEGHADAIGNDSYNLTLSERRAKAVAQELRYEGINGAQLAARGYGEKYPVAPNTNADGSDNPAGRAKNRRVEVVIEN